MQLMTDVLLLQPERRLPALYLGGKRERRESGGEERRKRGSEKEKKGGEGKKRE